jgi:hypothetical protein
LLRRTLVPHTFVQLLSAIKTKYMQFGNFNYPMPVNEPVLNYAPGSAEKKRLKEVLAELKKEKIDVPMYIGSTYQEKDFYTSTT